MKKFFSKASVMLMLCALAVAATSCNSYGEEQQTTKETITVKNSLRGVILDQDGAVLTGASVTINGSSVAVTGNTFESLGLNNGNYTVVVKKAGYKDSEPKVVALSTSTQTVNGEPVVVGQDVECVFYLVKEETKLVNIGATGDSQTIVVETSTQDDGTGNIVGNTQDPSDASLNSEITVTADVPGLDATQVAAVEAQMPAGFDINDLSFNLSNLQSLDEATRTIVVAGDALPGNYTFFTGATLETDYTIDFTVVPGDITIDVTLEMPKDVKDVIKVFRNTGAGWTEVTSSTTGNGIKSAKFQENGDLGQIVITLNKLEQQSFAIGALIDQSDPTPTVEPFMAGPVSNNTASAVSVPTMNYQAKTRGVVLTNITQGSMVDYLRKMVLRYYNIRAISDAEEETRTYTFNPPYSLPAGGQLYLSGFQNTIISVFKIANGRSSFQVHEYGDAFLYPYAIVPTETSTHGGGSND